jgi:predicted RNase H-like HicB family nuclease
LQQKQENTMFRYPARLKADEAGFTVTFRDIPEAITAGETREEAIDALATAMDFYFEDINARSRCRPTQSAVKP